MLVVREGLPLRAEIPLSIAVWCGALLSGVHLGAPEAFNPPQQGLPEKVMGAAKIWRAIFRGPCSTVACSGSDGPH